MTTLYQLYPLLPLLHYVPTNLRCFHNITGIRPGLPRAMPRAIRLGAYPMRPQTFPSLTETDCTAPIIAVNPLHTIVLGVPQHQTIEKCKMALALGRAPVHHTGAERILLI